MAPLRITVFGEDRHGTVGPTVQEVHPEGMHTVFADQEYPVRRQPESQRVLANGALRAAPEPHHRTLERISPVGRDRSRTAEVPHAL